MLNWYTLAYVIDTYLDACARVIIKNSTLLKPNCSVAARLCDKNTLQKPTDVYVFVKTLVSLCWFNVSDLTSSDI